MTGVQTCALPICFPVTICPEEREVCKSFAYAFDSGDKAVGKAESMAVKYVFLKNFVLESTDNEESRDHENNFKAPPPKKNIVEEVKAKAETKSATPMRDATPVKKTVSFNKPKPTASVAPAQADEIDL